jgi:alcohol dehydrogenase YqhD (iron-dependent ADH family)
LRRYHSAINKGRPPGYASTRPGINGFGQYLGLANEKTNTQHQKRLLQGDDMQFEFQNPTRLIFGAGTLSRLGEIASAQGSKALLVTGGGSVKSTGVLGRAVASLKAAGVTVVECSGVEPNPQIASVRRGAQTARDEACDLVIALGGGSTMDAAKVMAAAVFYDGDAWDLIGHGQYDWAIPTKALPIITVPTLAATGSEMNCSAVISNGETKLKSFVGSDCLFPKVALVDTELTLSVPKDQTAYGVCDIITHVTEAYFNPNSARGFNFQA